MKKLTTLLLILAVTSLKAQQVTDQEDRKKGLTHLKQTQQELVSTINGLSEDQLNFKASEDSWSIAECMEHIAISEKNLMGMVYMSLETAADPTRKLEIVMTDEQILGLITSREQRVKTRKEFEPTNSLGDFEDMLKTFKQRRKASMKFLKTTEAKLRNHYVEFPFGVIDAYQVILFMSGHTTRHTNQIKEILENDSFPG